MNDKCCATCLNIKFWECPFPHFYCEQNPSCPSNGAETPDTEYLCDLYIADPDSFIFT